MRRLFPAARPAPDLRPALLGVISLMVLLVPLLLESAAAGRWAGLALAVPAAAGLPPEPAGPVARLAVVALPAGGFRVEAAVRSTDVRAASAAAELRAEPAADLRALQAVLARTKGLDPSRERILLQPHSAMSAAEVVAWMDAVRVGPEGPLFPEIVLGAAVDGSGAPAGGAPGGAAGPDLAPAAGAP